MTDAYDPNAVLSLAGDAELLAAALEELGVHALEIARTVRPGLHGRRQSGSGDSFWQYRRFGDGDQASSIDWRRSARSEDGLYFVRETEWETAQTVYVWSDLSPSMGFRSSLAPQAKADRAILLMLALTTLMVEGGERVALPGTMMPSAHRRAPRLIAEHLSAGIGSGPAMRFPDPADMADKGTCVVFSDFLDPIETLAPQLRMLNDMNLGLHLVEIADPAEETLPYDGRVEFMPVEDGSPYLAGRVETIRDAYTEELQAHRDAVADEAHRLGATLLRHRTDRSPEVALLTLATQIRDEETAGYLMDHHGDDPLQPAGAR
ncbi:MAG: DUF58 domain-containing protein [Pseudomonadota bacterium]